jgi:hypothetical protein
MEIELELKLESPILLVIGFVAGSVVGFLLAAGGTDEARRRLRAIPERVAAGSR